MDEIAVRKDERDRIKRYARSWREQNDAIEKRLNDLLRKKDDRGRLLYTEEQAKEIVREAFELKTNRRINNILARRRGSASPGMQAFSEAVMTQRVQKMLDITDEAEEQAFTELAKIEEAEARGEKWVEIEDKTFKDGKTETRRITIAEARRRWYERAKEDGREFFGIVRSLLPQTVVQTLVDNRSAIDQYSLKEIDEQIKAEEDKMKSNKSGGD